LELGSGGTFELVPAASGFWADLRLRGLVVQQLPYRNDVAIARTLALTRALLADVAAKARAKGARPLFLLPDPAGWVTEALFAGADLPHAGVRLDGSEHFPNDGHPNQKGAERLADAVVAALGK
jgi:hypothetical protein